MINVCADKRDLRHVFEDLALRFGVSRKVAGAAAAGAWKAQAKTEHEQAQRFAHTLRGIEEARKQGTDELVVLFVAHPYIAYDKYLGADVIDTIEELGAKVLIACEYARDDAYKASVEFSSTMPWQINRELVGAVLNVREAVDGIVLVSAFPCGPDSLTNDAIMRYISGVPILNLVVDSRSGTAGLQTRVESFVDILRFHKAGGYL